MSESELQHAILDLLRKKYGSRAFIRKVAVGPMKVGFSASAKNPLTGFPDLLLILGGKFYGIEVKVPGGRLSPEQAIVHDAIREAGGVVYVVHSIEETVTALEGVR
jgi:hypothetical protein